MTEPEIKGRISYTLPRLCMMAVYCRYLSWRNRDSIHQLRLGQQDGTVAVFGEYLNGRRMP